MCAIVRMPADIVEGFEATSPTATSQMDDFKQRLDAIRAKKKELDDYATTGLKTALDRLQISFTPYVTSCGITNATAPVGSLEQTVADQVASINARLTQYKTNVLNPLATLRRDILAFLNVNGKTQEISKLVEENDRLRKELEEINDGLSTAYNREATIDTRDKAVSFNQTWGYLNRPLRRSSIPVLIVFGLIFAAAGLVGLYYISPYATVALEGSATSFLQQPAVWMTLAIGVIFGGIFITLKLTGQL
jgi:hypothetical protein